MRFQYRGKPAGYAYDGRRLLWWKPPFPGEVVDIDHTAMKAPAWYCRRCMMEICCGHSRQRARWPWLLSPCRCSGGKRLFRNMPNGAGYAARSPNSGRTAFIK